MAKGLKTGGRKKGSPNRSTTELKIYFDSIDLCLPEKIIELLPQLDNNKQVDTLLRMMEFVYAKRKAVEVKNEEFSKLSFVDAIKFLGDSE